MAGKSVNIRDVASRAGVSVGTASMTLNNRSGVSASTRQAVLDAARELGYVPNVVGKALNRKKCGAIGVVVPVAVPPLFPNIVDGINDFAESSGLPIFVSYSRDDTHIEHRMIQMFRHLHVDGLILAAVPSRDNLDAFRQIASERPIIQVERYVHGMPGHFVGSENINAAHEYTRQFLEAGHNKVGCVLGEASYSVNDERYMGYSAAMQEAGIQPSEDCILRLGKDRGEETRQKIREYLTRPGAPRAILWCVTMTRRLAEVLDEEGLTNGKNVDIILFDCDTVGDLRGMSFTNVVQDGFRIGREAARLCLEFSREDRDEESDQHRVEMRFPCKEQIVTCVHQRRDV